MWWSADVILLELSIPHYLHVGASPPVIDRMSKKHQLERGGQSMMMLAGLGSFTKRGILADDDNGGGIYGREQWEGYPKMLNDRIVLGLLNHH